ncbi:MAG: YdcF family protein [Erysipelotrichales bacterium]|nr:YdcF family protein [Erysipelotrichales bacterium]
MKNKLSIVDSIIYFYIVCHALYSVYMFTVSVSYGGIWLAITLVEGILLFIGKKKLSVILKVLACCCILQSCISFGLLVSGNDSDIDNADSVLVLGYQLTNNEMSDTLKYRLDKAYEYAVNNPDSTLVLCGGVTRENTVSEASVMREYLLDLGIGEKRIQCEDKSTDTIENIQNSLDYVDKNSKIVVLSSNYHVTRAKMICEKVGLNVKRCGSKAPLMLLPNQFLFEKLGILKMLIRL